jgi:hypothetical protein
MGEAKLSRGGTVPGTAALALGPAMLAMQRQKGEEGRGAAALTLTATRREKQLHFGVDVVQG